MGTKMGGDSKYNPNPDYGVWISIAALHSPLSKCMPSETEDSTQIKWQAVHTSAKPCNRW